MSGNKKVKDKEVFLFNPVTNELDLALKFNSARIVTTDKNMLDRENLIFDAVSGLHLPMGNLVITDDDGNAVLADEVANLPSEEPEQWENN